MARITESSLETWSAGVVVADGGEIWRVVSGNWALTTEDAPAAQDGVHLARGEAVWIAGGKTVKHKLFAASPTPDLRREAFG
jgi:hypothetical protein